MGPFFGTVLAFVVPGAAPCFAADVAPSDPVPGSARESPFAAWLPAVALLPVVRVTRHRWE